MIDDILITKESFDVVKPLSKNIDFNTRVLPYALEAQRFDLKPYLGNAFYLDLMKNQTLDKYVELLNGVEYEYPTGTTLHFDGIKLALVYFCMARFRLNQQITDTPFGVVTKTSEFSEPVADKTIFRSSTELKKAADAIMYDVIAFISAKGSTVYPLYKNGSCASNTNVNKIKITGVSRV